MCDICLKEGSNELKREYVLIQYTIEYHVNYSVNRKTEIARICVSVCEDCYLESCRPAENQSDEQRGIWVSFKRWWNKKSYFPTKEQLVADIGERKLGQLYPLEVSKIGMTMGKYPLYFIQPAEM